MAATKSKSKTAAKKAKPSAKKAKAAPASKPKKGAATSKKAAPLKSKPKAPKQPAAKVKVPKVAKDVLDFGEFPAGSVTRHEMTLCLSCIFKLFTNQMGLAPRTAYNEIRRYAPTVGELTAREPQRPFFKPTGEKSPRCPYCEAPKRWHAQLRVYRVEGGKASDAARRALVKRLPTKDEQFLVGEEKKTARQVFFEWLERLGQALDFEEDAAWMSAAARAYLERREPKADWAAAFDGARAVRRSQRIEEGWERDGARLFLAPALYNDVLLVQYLVSRSHRHGGRTFEGRLTLPDLVGRMRRGGHLDAQGITDRDRFDVLEQLVEHLTGGDAPARLHFITDRRELIDRARDLIKQ
ncbi:MAG: hypothetical protein QOH49_4478 [Acidobacteriota bacterium]|nr:hypothetical protein [Acidobacteriota bacterium]